MKLYEVEFTYRDGSEILRDIQPVNAYSKSLALTEFGLMLVDYPYLAASIVDIEAFLVLI